MMTPTNIVRLADVNSLESPANLQKYVLATSRGEGESDRFIGRFIHDDEQRVN